MANLISVLVVLMAFAFFANAAMDASVMRKQAAKRNVKFRVEAVIKREIRSTKERQHIANDDRLKREKRCVQYQQPQPPPEPEDNPHETDNKEDSDDEEVLTGNQPPENPEVLQVSDDPEETEENDAETTTAVDYETEQDPIIEPEEPESGSSDSEQAEYRTEPTEPIIIEDFPNDIREESTDDENFEDNEHMIK